MLDCGDAQVFLLRAILRPIDAGAFFGDDAPGASRAQRAK